MILEPRGPGKVGSCRIKIEGPDLIGAFFVSVIQYTSINPKNAIIAGTRSKKLYNVAIWILMKSNVFHKNMMSF